MALTVAGPVGCEQGSKEGAGERERSASGRSMAELGGASILGADRKVCPYRLRDPIDLAHADRQRLVDGVAQLNGGCGRAAQISHRDGNDIGAGSA